MGPHPTPDDSGSWTNLSDADYARFKAGLPPGGDTPAITVTAPVADGQGATAMLAGGAAAAGAAEGTMFEVAGSGLARLAASTAGQALLRAAGVVLAPKAIMAGTAVYLGYKGVQYLIDHGALPALPGFSPPPVPTSPPPLVPPPVDNPLETLVPPPVPGGAGNEDLTITPPVPGNEGLVPPDGLQGPIIFASNTYMPAANGKVFDTFSGTWTDQAAGQASSPPVLGSDVQTLGTQISGTFFPTTPQTPNTIMYRLDGAGNITSYQVWADDGLPAYKVDFQGAAHGGVPTPHTTYYPRNPAPSGRAFINSAADATTSLPAEIP